MTHFIVPAIWLIVLIVGLPQLSETVYTPSLPDIAHTLCTSESMVEYTLTIYLFGFAVGSLFWGNISDKYGRKPCILAGIVVFIVGCIGCFFSSSIGWLMLSRFVQAFGGSIGSVLGQALCRDSFQGPQLGRAYSVMGGALGLFPALGPVIGGVIAENFHWSRIFLFLILFAVILMVLVLIRLPETHKKSDQKSVSLMTTAKALMHDKYVIGYGLIVAACNGIQFSYFAEGPFYLMEGLGLSPSRYGFSFFLIAIATVLGGMFSRKLHSRYSSKEIMQYGIGILILSSLAFSFIALSHAYLFSIPKFVMIILALISYMSIVFGICMTTSNALALALVNYKHAIGTASSLFGFFYYCLISLFTFGMGALHNGTLLVMPLYFLFLSFVIMFVQKRVLK